MRRITTVTSPAATTALVTLATVKEELALTSVDAARDNVLTRYISAASRAMQNYRGAIFATQSYQDEITIECGDIRSAEGGGPAPLLLAVYPVISIASVTEDDVALETSDWRADISTGFLFRKDSAGDLTDWSASKIVVAYSAGFAAIPDDVANACIEIVKRRYYARLRDPDQTSRTVVGVFSADYADRGKSTGASGLPIDVERVLDGYRIPVIG